MLPINSAIIESVRESRLRVFEIDKPATQEWKRNRLIELGYGVPDHLLLTPDGLRPSSGEEFLIATT